MAFDSLFLFLPWDQQSPGVSHDGSGPAMRSASYSDSCRSIILVYQYHVIEPSLLIFIVLTTYLSLWAMLGHKVYIVGLVGPQSLTMLNHLMAKTTMDRNTKQSCRDKCSKSFWDKLFFSYPASVGFVGPHRMFISCSVFVACSSTHARGGASVCFLRRQFFGGWVFCLLSC